MTGPIELWLSADVFSGERFCKEHLQECVVLADSCTCATSQLAGPIDALSTCVALESLNLAGNKFDGKLQEGAILPTEEHDFRLQRLILCKFLCSCTGSIDALSILTGLTQLKLNGNRFSGECSALEADASPGLNRTSTSNSSLSANIFHVVQVRLRPSVL